MILNIILVLILGAFIGTVAHFIMGGDGGLIHNAFIGIVGILLADVITRVFGSEPYGVIKNILLDIAGACILIAMINVIKSRMRGQDDQSD